MALVVSVEEREEFSCSFSCTEGGAGKAAKIKSFTALPRLGETVRVVSESSVGRCSEKETFFFLPWKRPDRRFDPSLSEDEEFDTLLFTRHASSNVGDSRREGDAEYVDEADARENTESTEERMLDAIEECDAWPWVIISREAKAKLGSTEKEA